MFVKVTRIKLQYAYVLVDRSIEKLMLKLKLKFLCCFDVVSWKKYDVLAFWLEFAFSLKDGRRM